MIPLVLAQTSSAGWILRIVKATKGEVLHEKVTLLTG